MVTVDMYGTCTGSEWDGVVKKARTVDAPVCVAAVTKPQRERKKRLDEIMAWQEPGVQTVSLPKLPKGAAVAAFTFSIHDGVRWRV